MRVALDTDVLVAAVRSRRGTARAWMRAILTGEATLLLSVPLALQYEAVLTRPEHLAAAGATVEQVTALLDTLVAVCRPVEISFLWRPILRDAATVSGVRVDRDSSYAFQPIGYGVRPRSRPLRPAAAWSTRTVASVISGPIPSPASTARLILPSVAISTPSVLQSTGRRDLGATGVVVSRR